MGLFNNHRQPTYACLDAGTRAFRVTSTGGVDHLIDCVLDQVAVERLVPESLMVRGLEPTVDEQFAATGQGYAVGDSGSPVWYGSKAGNRERDELQYQWDLGLLLAEPVCRGLEEPAPGPYNRPMINELSRFQAPRPVALLDTRHQGTTSGVEQSRRPRSRSRSSRARTSTPRQPAPRLTDSAAGHDLRYATSTIHVWVACGIRATGPSRCRGVPR